MSTPTGRLLIYAPVPLYKRDGQLFVEKQAVNGLRLWAQNFEKVMVMMPLWAGQPPQGWVSAAEVSSQLDRVEFHLLPEAYRPDQFLRKLPATRRQIAELIDQADYMSFAIGGLFGDWGLVANRIASQKGRSQAVWTDRVESQVVWRTRKEGSWRHRVKAWLTYLPMVWAERCAIRRAEMGLFHGRETFDHYARFSKNPQLVHDIHYSAADHISGASLRTKMAAAANGPLKLVYTGRADGMKGPMDWVAVLAELHQRGIDFQATWLGDGNQLAQMQAKISTLGLSDRVSTPGFVSDRTVVLKALQAADLFLFCHKTPESPRCLIEALFSGTPIVGYDSVYARDLIADHKGGALVAIGDITGLADEVERLARDRSELAKLMEKAREDGAPFDDEAVFRHRSELIKTYLSPRRQG